MLHIAIVSRRFATTGGLELYTYKLVQGLLEAGHRVAVFCQQDEANYQHPLLTVHCFSQISKDAGKSEQMDHYLKEASRAIASNGPFDVVHSQHLGIPNADVVTFHNFTVGRFSQTGTLSERIINDWKIRWRSSYRKRDEMDKLLSSTASILIFCSKQCQEDYEKRFDLLRFRDRASHLVAYPGSEFLLDMHSEDSTRSIAEESLRSSIDETGDATTKFLFVGRGYRKKGLDILLKACQILKNKGYRFELMIAGLKEKPLDSLRLALLGLKEQVRYLGFQKYMQNVYASVSVLVFPSRVDVFGMAPLQAMRYGVVPIVSAVTGVSEILTHGSDSYILENPLNPNELAQLMANAIEQPAALKRLSQQAMITASAHTWPSTVFATIEAYKKVITMKTEKRSQINFGVSM